MWKTDHTTTTPNETIKEDDMTDQSNDKPDKIEWATPKNPDEAKAMLAETEQVIRTRAGKNPDEKPNNTIVVQDEPPATEPDPNASLTVSELIRQITNAAKSNDIPAEVLEEGLPAIRTQRGLPLSAAVSSEPGAVEKTSVTAEMANIVRNAAGGENVRLCIDADCPNCGWAERWFDTETELFGCSKCDYTSQDRNA